MAKVFLRLASWGVLACLLGLTGCSGMRLVETQVNSFAPQPVAPGARYRFERLPSQQAEATAQTRLESLAEQALAKVGLRRAGEATLGIQVSAVLRQENTATDPSGLAIGWNLGWVMGSGVGGQGSLMLGNQGLLFPGLATQPVYWRRVSLVMRDLASQTVVFESHASAEDRWRDDEVIWAAMLDAALQGFPRPPAGVRRVAVEIPR